ncbi:MAG: glycosyltransferase [Anaerolineae bacterium]|nr:glycosyltransferase [Anaerolineae bacterium]
MQTIDNLDIGGAQEVVHTLVKYLKTDCTPIVCTFKDGPLRQTIEALGVPVEVLPQRRHSIVKFPLFMMDMIRIWRSLAALVNQYQVDIIQTHLLRVLDFIFVPLLYTTKLRGVYWTFHNAQFELAPEQVPDSAFGLLTARRYAYRLLYRMAARLVSGFVAVSDEVKNSMVRIIGPIQDQVTVICNGVDTERYEKHADRSAIRQSIGVPQDAYLIIVLATLKKQKGHCYFVQAMRTLVSNHPHVHTIFVGDGPLRADIEKQIADLGLGDHIHLLGSRHDVPDLLAASDLFVLPSLWEGLAMALLEGMATGLPIVASEVSGTVQVIVPGESGILLPPGNPTALVEAIEGLILNPNQAKALSQGAKERVQAFSARKQANEHIELFQQTR